MAQPYYLLFSSCTSSNLPIPAWLGELLGGLRLLLGDLLLRHDGHPRWYWPGDGLLGYVVMVDKGEEAPTPPRSLRRVVAVHSSRHAATLLLQRGNKIKNKCLMGKWEKADMQTQLWFRIVEKSFKKRLNPFANKLKLIYIIKYVPENN